MDYLIPKEYSTQAKKFLKTHGAEHVKYLEIVRTPLSAGVNSLLNVVTVGAFNKAIEESSYDKMFHLAILIESESGKQYQFEKNQTIRLGNPHGITSETEHLKVVLPRQFEIWQLLARAEQKQGKEKYFHYTAFENNCQSFVMAVLQGSKLASAKITKFVKQDAIDILKKLPAYTERLANFLTDIAAVVVPDKEHDEKEKEHNSDHGKDKILAVCLEQSYYTLDEAKQYLVDHDYKLTIHHNIHKYYRFPQANDEMIKRYKHKTQQIDHGYLILGIM